MRSIVLYVYFFFFNDTATTEIYTLSLHDALPILLVTGHTMASSPVFKNLLEKMASKLKTPRQAIIVVTLVSTIACILNWGFGLVIGAIFAKEIAKKLKGVDYRLLIASAYTGFLVWHGGLSGSIPLQLASGGEVLKQQTLGVVSEAIPTSQTLFSPMNLYILIGLLILLPIINAAMYPSPDEVVTVNPELLKEIEPVTIEIGRAHV